MSFGFGFGFTKITAAIRAAFSPASLFANNEPGVWFDPSDLSTLFQDVAGTTPVTAVEQPVGLMLDKSRGLALGPELVTNGTFDVDTSGWTATQGAVVTWSAGSMSVQRTASDVRQAAHQILTCMIGKTYKLTLSSVGNVSIRVNDSASPISGTFALSTTSASGTYVFVATSTTQYIHPSPNNVSTTLFDNISVRELPGAHAIQSVSTKRPVLSALVNQYVGTATLATQNVTTLAAAHTLRFEGTGTITLSGTATGTYSAGTHAITCTAGTLTSTVSGSVLNADLRVANVGAGLPAYQSVVDATNYDTAGFPHYLRFDGVDDWLVTPTITPGTDKAQVFAGVRKLALGAQAQVIVELGSNSFGTNGISVLSGGAVSNQTNEYSTIGFASAGYGRDYAVAAMPSTDVLTALFDVANPVPTSSQMLRANGAFVAGTQAAGTNMGAGNFLQNGAYIGQRGGTQRPFNGHLYGLIVRFGPNLPLETIQQVEQYIANKTGISL